MKEKVIVGLSGGVDSAVAAYLLKKKGYDVHAVFMQNWDNATNNDILGNPFLKSEKCEQEIDYSDAKKVAKKLGVSIEKVDFIEEYWDRVFKYFLSEYKKNRTPNPDILCNNEIKFKAFLDFAMSKGAKYIATGHYANKVKLNDIWHIKRGVDSTKDQSYFLSQIKSEQIKKTIFPLGEISKLEVRRIAKDLGLDVAEKKDSTGICFIGERNFSSFLKNYLPAKKGPMKRLDGTYIKEHNGLMFYTIGQRKGLEIGGVQNVTDPWYVVGKSLVDNTLYVEPNSNHINLYSDKCILKDVIWRGKRENGDYTAKFRYRQKDSNIKITFLENNNVLVEYPQKVKAVTPGQLCAIYQNDICLGAGFINEVYYEEKLREYA